MTQIADPAILRITAALDRMNDVLTPMHKHAHEMAEKRRQALSDIQHLLDGTQPTDIDEARELLQQVSDRVEAILGGPLVKEVI